MLKRKVNRDSDASPSEDSASASDGSDFEGRPRKQVARGAGKKAAAVIPKASAGPRLKKSIKPEWNRNGWSHDKLETELASKCIERWCLLPPYNTRIPDTQWKEYYLERRALDEINTKHSDKSKKIVSEELGQELYLSFVLLPRALPRPSTVPPNSMRRTRRGLRELCADPCTLPNFGETTRKAVATIPALSIPRRVSTLPSDSEPLSNWCTTSTGASLGRERGFQTLWSTSGISKSAIAKIQGSVRPLSRIVGLVRNLASSVSKSSTWCAFLGKIPSDCHLFHNNSKIKGTTAQKITDFEEQFFGS
ncbi:hypothetical protein B0H14DRAFT_3174954, partial [Mycena olivaceomarginata]